MRITLFFFSLPYSSQSKEIRVKFNINVMFYFLSTFDFSDSSRSKLKSTTRLIRALDSS